MASDRHNCSCCSHPVSSPSVYQTLTEMDFERGIWSAAMNGDLDRVQFLVQKGTDPNLRDSTGYTALTSGGATPLHRSAYCGHLDVVRLLLHHRADPKICDDDGASPLHKAAEQGHEEVCELLLEHCPALCSQVNKRLQLPFQLAPQQDLQELLKPDRHTASGP
ncbi:ankyrin repeat domain-containing protein 39 isoform X2 [Gasterosteus aculeatus]|uniref:ankyrin repeat domain-containing protein 39 isoform X2 n=1 Tax=Gasterosteus aculeatus aculeatus TaxID=481459 RepID=UPI001A98DD56|nr:ankyrin repeat domain-containing protein 39 isoform X2 [Gasterosteus aculeatus aculeatus]